jgi:hypothetical protein
VSVPGQINVRSRFLSGNHVIVIRIQYLRMELDTVTMRNSVARVSLLAGSELVSL